MNTSPTYCYWSVATGPHAALMERCVASARAAGVFKEFHVMTDRPIQGAESYEAYEVELTDKLFKLVYLKAAINKLNFDYYVWLDADTEFRRNPRNLLACLSRSPIHAPLEVNLSGLIAQADGGRSRDAGACADESGAGEFIDLDAPHPRLYGLSVRDYAELFSAAGVSNPVYWSRNAFWIVRRSAIERVCELALHFRAFAKERGITVDATAGLSYAMQMLCANPARHERTARPDLWADQTDEFSGDRMGARPSPARESATVNRESAGPAILHLSRAGRPLDDSHASLKGKEDHELTFA